MTSDSTCHHEGLVTMLSFGLLLSTYAYTQQQAMWRSPYIMIFLLMNGLFTPTVGFAVLFNGWAILNYSKTN